MRRLSLALAFTLFSLLFIVTVFSAFSSWSDSIYPSMNPQLMPLYFITTVFLLILLLSKKSLLQIHHRFSLVIFHSFLTRIVSVILYYPGISGDNWVHLGRARTWDIFGRYYLLLGPVLPAEMRSIPGKIYTVQRGLLQQSLEVSLAKMFQIDVYWVHLLLMGVLWSFFVPVIAYKISRTLGGSESASLLASFMVSNAPLLLIWTAYPVANSFGLFFRSYFSSQRS